MKSTILILALAAASAGAHAAVTVNFPQPDKYADMPFDKFEQERVMKEIREHVTRLAGGLPAGQDLKVDVLDIDLAGREEPGRRGHELRILRGGADWPMIQLRYSLESQGKVLKSGEERLTDMNYLQGFNRYSASESLRYEKKMLDRWFKEIAPDARVARGR